MQTTYINTTTTSTTPATVLNSDGRSIVIRKIVIGNPVNSGNITVFSENNALSNNTTQILSKISLPGTVNTLVPVVIDFRTASGAGGGSTEDDGLFCQTGGSIAIDQTMQVSVLWDYAEG